MEKSLKKVIDLVYLAKQNDVEIILSEGRLRLKISDNKKIADSLLEDIRNNKQLIIDYLSNNSWKTINVDKNYQIINQFDRKEITNIPLSFSQERLWFIDQLEGSLQYHAPVILRLKGNLNLQALSNAFRSIVFRHEILRTIYQEEDGRVYQLVRNKGGWELMNVDGAAFKGDEQALQEYVSELIRHPFNLSKDYMLRASLIRLDEEEHMLVVTMHHIASDAWSLSILVKEVVELYNSFIEERVHHLPSLELQYADYAVWQRNVLQGEFLDRKLSFWKEKLEGITSLQLPTDYPRPSNGSTRGASLSFIIEKELSARLQDLSRQNGVTLFMTLLSTFKVLLYRYSGQSDISVGTSIANRPQKELEVLVGFFVNTLTLRSSVTGDIPFTELLQQVRATTLGAYEHQDVSFEKVVEAVVKERDMSRSPLFQVMLVLLNTPEITELHLGDLELSFGNFDARVSKFDFTFFLNETPGGLQGTVEYSTDLYTSATIERMLGHYKVLLQSVVSTPDQKVGLLPMLSKKEEQWILEGFNKSSVPYPKYKSIVDLFEEQVKKTPNAEALVFEGASLTYTGLNERADQLANCLRSHGIMEESLVPLYVDRGIEMLVGLLGILKSGAAYVPIDTDFPQDRISYMLEDTGSRIIVSSRSSSGRLTTVPGMEIIETDNLGSQTKVALSARPLPNHLAYVIYTSGSTGKPKGVMISHRSLVDYYYGLNRQVQIDQCRSFALVSSIATDLGNTVVYGSLLSGGTLHLFTKESISNIGLLHRYFSVNVIDCIKIVPSHWKALSADDSLLLPKKLLIFGGESLPRELVEKIRLSGRQCVVANHYGPTETTIGKLLHVVGQENKFDKTIPIGRPFSNTKVYVLSKEMQPCPIGIPGQLYIAGDGLARGYYNNETLTKEKFIKDPFDKESGGLMYCTGDLVKYLPGGDILFIGRVDDQVKIRGYRVEPGEIQSVLQLIPGVRQAVVMARADRQGNLRLVGYIVPQGVFDREGIQEELKKQLPEFMVPSVLMELDHMPLTANGKVDRKSLPDPDVADSLSGQYVAPRNEVEAALAVIWGNVLELEQVGVHDDFFELGGHSLLAVRLISAIRKAFQTDIPLNAVFIYPTISAMAANTIEKSKHPSGPIKKFKYLVPLKTQGEKIPLYIICGGGGTARRFKNFVDMMDEDQPAYALQPIVEGSEIEKNGSMKEIANKFIEEIFINNPDGPYALSGHCTGGIIAFEIAKEFRAMGKKVHMLAMFDTIIHTSEIPKPANLNNYFNIPVFVKRITSKAVLKFDFETYLLRKHTRTAIEYKLKSVRSLIKKINRKKVSRGELEHVGLEIFNESSAFYRNAVRNYTLTQYDGEILLFYAKERYYFTDVRENIRFKKVFLNENTQSIWQKYARSISIYQVEGDHSNIFESPNGHKFALLLQQQLNRSIR